MVDRKAILLSIFLALFLSITLASAADVAYIYRKEYKIDQNVLDVFSELGLTVDLIEENSLPNSFSSYRFIFVGDERFINELDIPVGDVPSVVANSYHGDEWGLVDDSVFQLARINEPLDVHISGNGLVDVYTQALYQEGRSVAIPYLYLRNTTEHNDMAPGLYKVAATHQGDDLDLGAVIAYGEVGGFLHGNKRINGDLCFYGIDVYNEATHSSNFWTNAAKDLFIDCVNFVAIACNDDSECGEQTVGQNYCGTDGNVYRDIQNPVCSNPGTYESSCSYDTITELVDTCQYDCSGGVCQDPNQCEDDLDNDNDNLIDEEDPGCWIDPSDPNTYDPKDDDESDYTIICSENSDCGVDGYVGGLYCGNDDNVYRDYETHTCLYPGTGLSECTSETEPIEQEVCEYGCTGGVCNDRNLHDVAIIDSGNSVNGILFEYLNGTDILDEVPTLSCDDILRVKVTVENKGDFVENISVDGDLDGTSFLINDIENSQPGNINTRSSLSPYISLEGLNGTFTVTVEASIPVDNNTGDNVVTRDVYVMCPEEVFECSDNLDNDNDNLIDSEDPGCWIDPTNPDTYDPYDDDESNHTIVCYVNSDCGIDQYVGGEYCDQDGNVSRDFETHTCLYPGTGLSECTSEVEPVLKDICEHNCADGMCVGQCTIDSDCGIDYYTDNYCGEDENVYKDAHNFTCDDGNCSENVTPELVEACDHQCSDGVCVGQCTIDSDCGTDYYGSEYCGVNETVYRDAHNFTCDDGDCNEDITPEVVEVCEYMCSDGACIEEPPIECYVDLDCDDNDAYTYDECNLAGTPSSYCSNTPVNCATDNDCGITGFIGNEYCLFDDSYKNYQSAICQNPGTKQSYCTVNLTQTFLVDCGEDSCESTDELYCVGNSVYETYLCTERGCEGAGICYNNLTQEGRFVEACEYDCVDGECVNETPECTMDSDCGTDYYGSEYCGSNETVYKDAHNFTCDDGDCSEHVTPEVVEVCEYMCSDGECIPPVNECTLDSDCDDDYYSDDYCKGDDVYKDFHDFSCEDGNCTEEVTKEKVRECEYMCSDGECIEEPPIECYEDLDCDDNDAHTYDECNLAGTPSSYCSNTPVNCATDNDCGFTGFFGTEYCLHDDVYKNYQSAICENPGTKQSYCNVDLTQTFLDDCGIGSCDDDGEQYCVGKDIYVTAGCELKGCVDGACYTNVSFNDTYIETCEYGCTDGECDNQCTVDSECSDDYYSDNYCKDDDVYRNFHDFSCEDGSCTEDVEHELVEECSEGCTDGACDPPVYECTMDSDCDDDYYSENYCKNDNVYRDFHDFSCENGNCTEDITKEKVERCKHGCYEGECLPPENECRMDSQCEDDYYSDNYCRNDDVYRKFFDFSCEDGECVKDVSKELVEECSEGCRDGACIDECVPTPGCEEEMIFKSWGSKGKGEWVEYTVKCDGEIQTYAYDDNFVVGVERVEDGDKNLLVGCDNEVYEYFSHEYEFCYDSVPQHGAIICDRDAGQIASLHAGQGLGCPGGKMDNYKIEVKEGDVLHINHAEWARGDAWVNFEPYNVIHEETCDDEYGDDDWCPYDWRWDGRDWNWNGRNWDNSDWKW